MCKQWHQPHHHSADVCQDFGRCVFVIVVGRAADALSFAHPAQAVAGRYRCRWGTGADEPTILCVPMADQPTNHSTNQNLSNC